MKLQLTNPWHGIVCLTLGLVIALQSGCGTISGTRSTGTPPTRGGEFMAGAAEVDITPLPGYPMGGHSIAATIGRGVWTRLHASAFYLQDSRGTNLVLVSCDLWGMPAGLADRVAELVAADARGKVIGRQSLIIAATHTHQSPGNFSSSAAYNLLASPVPGFDRLLFDYLSKRITSAVLQAVAAAEPARVYFLQQTNLAPIQRNRSMPAFVLDPECVSTLKENAWIPPAEPSAEYPDPEASRAVDPRLRVLRIEGSHGLIGLAGFIAMHPTTMSHETEVYTADVFGVAETEAEQSLQIDGQTTPIVALFNGPEGDISPLWKVQDRATCLNLGGRIAGALVRSATGGEPAEGNIDSVFALTSIAAHSFTDDFGHPRRTSAFAEAGAALVAGAEDGRTIFNYDGHVEGTRYAQRRSPDEGDKLDLLALGLPIDVPRPIKKMTAKVLGAPQIIPLGVAKMGNVLFATLPGEFTTTMGRRIELAIQRDNPDLKNVILIGLADEYLSYFTTPEEFDSQQYEGASTLYGPASGPFVQNQLMRLARDIETGQKEPFSLKYRFQTGPQNQFLPPKGTNELYNADDGLANILEDTASRFPYRKFPSIAWNDPWMLRIALMNAGDLPIPRVWVEAQQGDGSWQPLTIKGKPEDNTGLNFVTALTVSEPKAKQLTWTAFWMPPRGVSPAARYRLCVNTISGKEEVSPFHLPLDCPLSH